jgi:hypothetical protein
MFDGDDNILYYFLGAMTVILLAEVPYGMGLIAFGVGVSASTVFSRSMRTVRKRESDLEASPDKSGDD